MNGSRRIVKIKTTNSFTAPLNGMDYVANSVYLGSEQVVYNGTGNSVTVTGLAPHRIYWFRVYEASCSSTNSQYLTTTSSGNPRARITLFAPPQVNPNRPESASEENSNIPLLIFPNPNNGTFTLQFNLHTSTKLSAGNADLKITDMTGRVLFKQKINSQLSIFNSPFSKGIYFVRVSDGERSFTQKLIIE